MSTRGTGPIPLESRLPPLGQCLGLKRGAITVRPMAKRKGPDAPPPPTSPDALAQAWAAAVAALPPGWAIYYVQWVDRDEFERFWVAGAHPDEYLKIVDGYGDTPDAALLDLATELRTLGQ